MSDKPKAPLPPHEARRRYLRFLGVRLAGLAIMVAGVWASRSWGQAPGLALVLIGGLALFIRPRHLGLTK